MNATRPLLRTARVSRSSRLRNVRINRVQQRFQSSESSSTAAKSSTNPAVIGGLAGGLTAFVGGYAWYHFSGAKSVVNAGHQTKQYFDATAKQIQESAPNPNEALKFLRQTASSYAVFIPGAKGVVDGTFDEFDAIHDSHREEVDAIVKDCYEELKQVSQKGLNVESAKQGWDVLVKHLQRVRDLAADSMSEIVDRHPELKNKLGGSVDQLKQMGDRLGPEAKEIADDVWKKASEIAKSSGSLMSAENVDKLQKLFQDTVERMRKLGDEAWDKAMEQAKPYLDKSPQVKQLVEENADALKQGNAGELIQKIKSAVDSGSTGDLQDYVRSAADKAQSSGMGGLQDYLNKVPGGDQVLPNLSKLQEMAQKHGKEAEELFKSTVSEVSQVLSRKADEAKKLGGKAKEGASKGT